MGANRKRPGKKHRDRGNTFRYLLVRLDGTMEVISQDQRRKHNVVTGRSSLGALFAGPATTTEIAKRMHCAMVFREKA